MVEVENLTKTYEEVLAVDGVSFEIHMGEIFGLLGPNGAGKISTIKFMEGIRELNGSLLRVADIDPWREPSKLRNVIGVQLQSAGLPETKTPCESMKIFCAYHDVPPQFDLLITAAVISISSPLLFDANIPVNWINFVLVITVTTVNCAGISILIGVKSSQFTRNSIMVTAYLCYFNIIRWFDVSKSYVT